MNDAATKIAAVWRSYDCRNKCLDSVDWGDKYGDYLFRKHFVIWPISMVEPRDCVFHYGKHALTFRELLNEEITARNSFAE